MRPRVLVREACAAAWSAKIPTALVLVVVAAMCFVALVTVGRSAANAAAVQENLAAAGSRLLTVTDAGGQGFINASTLGMIDRLSTVQLCVGIGTAVDVANARIGSGGAKVTAWPIHGDVTRIGRLLAGRYPGPGEALVSVPAEEAFGLVAPVGAVVTAQGRVYPVVGAFAAVAPFTDMGTGVIINANDEPDIREVRIVITSIGDAEATQSAVLAILSPADLQGVYVDSPVGLADTARQLQRQLVGYARSLLLLILGVGAVFIATVVLSDTLIRRRDLGRRRTLGATRAGLTALVCLRTALPVIAGALLGTTAALVIDARLGSPVPPDFGAAVAVLAGLTGVLAAIPPAVYAAHRDPVRIMRTP